MIKGAASTKCDFIRTSHLYGSFVHQVNICSMFDDYLIKNRISKNIAIANWCWRTMSCGNEWKCKLSFLYINNLFDILESGKRNGPLWPMANRRISCNGLLSVIFESMAPIVQLAHTHTHTFNPIKLCDPHCAWTFRICRSVQAVILKIEPYLVVHCLRTIMAMMRNKREREEKGRMCLS